MASEYEIVKVAMRESQRAIAVKTVGNEFYAAGEMQLAHERYTTALLLAPPLLPLRKMLPALAEVRVAILANRAAACLALGWFVNAVLDASSAIAEVCVYPASGFDIFEEARLLLLLRHMAAATEHCHQRPRCWPSW